MWFLMFWLGFAYAVGALTACVGAVKGAVGAVDPINGGRDRTIAVAVGILMCPVAVVIWPLVALFTLLQGMFAKQTTVAHIDSEGKVTWLH